MSNRLLGNLIILLGLTSLAGAVPSVVERVNDSVYVIRDDAGNWGGMTNGITHQNRGDYTARKTLDLSEVPADVWEATQQVRLSVFFMVRDYSWHDLPQANGLDEFYEVVVNGQAHRYPTSGGAPVMREGQKETMAWYDFAIPKAELKRGPNEILIRKAPDSKGDDYLYLGIDNGARRGNSAVAFDGKTWTQDKLTIPGGNGEYMVRLYLLQRDTRFTITYTPGQGVQDEAHLLLYVGARGAAPEAGKLVLQPGQTLRLEWAPEAVDISTPVSMKLSGTGQARASWLDPQDKPQGTQTVDLAAGPSLATAANGTRTAGLTVTPVDQPVTLTGVTVTGAVAYHPLPTEPNMAPTIAAPACGPKLPPSDKVTSHATAGQIALNNGRLRARFEKGATLKLASLYNAITQTEMVRRPEAVGLFVVEIGDKRYAGNRDFALQSLTPNKTGFVAQLMSKEAGLTATLTVAMATEGLRLGLKLTNTGPQNVDFKVAFPHLAGLAVSDKPAGDYFFFPWGGGIYTNQAAIVRRGYGDHEALYQVMDLYSPARGGGLYLRLDDSEGWHKILALRKFIPGQTEAGGDALVGVNYRVREEYRWDKSSLGEVEGTGLAAEYLRRTRAPGASFAPADAVLAAHAGDWHTAMTAYASWAHRVWKWRPWPSAFRSVRNMMAAGWGQGILFKEGKYRTDFIQEPKPGVDRTLTDCLELMSWWDWSPLGPFMTPFDQLDKVLTPGQIKEWEGYFVKDPVTGQKMWNNQPGDYAGYNDRFGGLPAFRAAVQTYQKMGALTTLYTDPFRLDENCPIGRAHGKEWCVVNQDGKLSTGYDVFNPCHDLPAVREWVAQTMGRVMRETGADGIRLDEYGHRGWACYNPDHKHTYQEPGITQWQKATAEATRMVHAEMDKVRPGLVLTTEHPGYDYLMQYLDGCITYDYTVMATPLRPLECNIQRFYFPECKAYELDHRGADPGDRKKFWNAVESFGRYYPLPFYTILSENEAAYQSRDCTPLLVTPGQAERVYVNRFAGGGKTFYHLFNSTGHTVADVALAVKLAPGQHLFDLLNCEEATTVELPGKPFAYVSVYLPREDVGCVGQFTRRLEVSRNETTVEVTVSGFKGPGTLVLADREGRKLLSQPVKTGRNALALDKLTVEGRPACVKLLAGRELVDIAELP